MRNKHLGYTNLRILSTICVVWLHTCSTLIDNPSIFPLSHGKYVFFCTGYQMMYWAVPCFFMLTGSLLLKKAKDLTMNVILKKYVLRILLALLLFGIPYAIIKNTSSNAFSISLLFNSLLDVVEGDSFGHLWYLYELIGIYLVLPILSLFAVNVNKQMFRNILIILFCLDFVLPLFSNLNSVKIAFDVPMKYTIFYVLLGFYFSEYKNLLSVRKDLFIIGIVLALIIIFNLLDETNVWTQYKSPLIALISMAMFSLYTKKDERIESNDWRWKIDRMCFTIYLIHPLFIQFTYRVLHLNPSNYSLYPLATIVFATIFILLSFIASYVIRLISPLRKYVL